MYMRILLWFKTKKFSKQEIDKEVKEALKLVKLTGYEQRHIDEMSGDKTKSRYCQSYCK